jgi:hypothetical protein
VPAIPGQILEMCDGEMTAPCHLCYEDEDAWPLWAPEMVVASKVCVPAFQDPPATFQCILRGRIDSLTYLAVNSSQESVLDISKGP